MKTEHQTLRDLLTAQSRRFEKKIFLEFENQEYTFAELDERTDRVATTLNRMGLGYGDRVALLLPNVPELVFFLLGAPKIGVVPVVIDPEGADAQAILSSCGASAVVTDSRFAGLMPSGAAGRNWVLTDHPSFRDAPFRGLAAGPVLGFWPDLAPEDAAVIAFTRGTGGPRKAVVLSHRNLISNCLQIMQPYRVDASDRFFCAIPLHSAFAQVMLLLVPCMVGGTCILRRDFSMEVVRDIQASQATVIAGSPGYYWKLLGAPGFSECDLPSLRLAVCSQGAMDQAPLRQFEKSHDAILVEAYGLTEAAALSCTNPYTGLRKAGSVGLPLPGQECRIVDELGMDMPPGKPGTILVRGLNVMKEYDGDPDASGQSLRSGWLHTDDTAYVDSDGYYYLVNR